MIRVNLLPWRAERRKAQRQHLAVLSGMVAVLGLVIVGVVHLTIDRWIVSQNERNEFIKKENTRLDKEIEQIQQLKTAIAALLARKQIIERLQLDRAQAVYLLQDLVKQVPDGIYLKLVKQTGLKINLVGYAQSNARVSTLMRNIMASGYLENPDLVEIKSASLNNKRLSEFTLNVSLKNLQAEDPAKASKAAPKAGAAKSG